MMVRNNDWYFVKGCKIDLEQRSGDHPPFILDSFGDIKYPVGSKILTFGKTCTVFSLASFTTVPCN